MIEELGRCRTFLCFGLLTLPIAIEVGGMKGKKEGGVERASE
jgi:hypothetical protein